MTMKMRMKRPTDALAIGLGIASAVVVAVALLLYFFVFRPKGSSTPGPTNAGSSTPDPTNAGSSTSDQAPPTTAPPTTAPPTTAPPTTAPDISCLTTTGCHAVDDRIICAGTTALTYTNNYNPSDPADFQSKCNVNCPGDTPFTQAQFSARTANMPEFACS